MLFSATTIVAILASVASAIPAEGPVTLNLHNGSAISTVTVGERSLLPGLEARTNFCSGSARCSNSQGFKNDCQAAYYNLEATTYKNGGDKSGVCSGKCGLFVQGDGCTANMGDMVNAYNKIRSNGCETCGWITESWAKGCVIKMDYVTGC